MVGYGLRMSTFSTKVTRHMNDEYELFTRIYASKCVVILS